VSRAAATRILIVALVFVTMSPDLNAADARMQIDHILIGINDLDQGIAEFEKATGVRPVYGGKHPSGTHNALISLGAGRYLEIIANQPNASDWVELNAFRHLTPVGWAISTTDVGATRAQLAASGLATNEPRAGSRVTLSGSTLSWNTFSLLEETEEAPFFIAWSSDSPHPSTTSPSGCNLVKWQVRAPASDSLVRLQGLLGAAFELLSEREIQFRLELRCPKGNVVFESPPAARDLSSRGHG